VEYRQLGQSGVKVSVIALGSMNFGPNPKGDWIGPGVTEDDAVEITRAAFDLGVNFIDTADLYQHGVSEEYVGKAIEPIRDSVVLATKVNAAMGPGVNDRGISAYHIVRACEASLKRMRTDRIDLYQLHSCSYDVPHDETLEALDRLVRAGKVIYVGCSNYPAWMIAEAMGICRQSGLAKFVSAQPRYNLLTRDVERDVLPVCERYGLGLLPWSPLAAGLLSGKYAKGTPPPAGTRWSEFPYKDRYDAIPDTEWASVEAVVRIARARGAEPAQVACAWLLSRRAVSSVLGGARTLDQVKTYIGTADVTLTPEEVAELDAVSAPDFRPPWPPVLAV